MISRCQLDDEFEDEQEEYEYDNYKSSLLYYFILAYKHNVLNSLKDDYQDLLNQDHNSVTIDDLSYTPMQFNVDDLTFLQKWIHIIGFEDNWLDQVNSNYLKLPYTHPHEVVNAIIDICKHNPLLYMNNKYSQIIQKAYQKLGIEAKTGSQNE